MNKFTKIVIGAHIVITAVIVGTFIALMVATHK